MLSRREFMSLGGAALASQAGPLWAQTALPRGPITLVVPFAPGGATDIVSRHIAKKVSEKTGIAMIVENVAGGGGVVGASRVARAAKDGTMLLMGTVSTHAINPLARTSPTYDAAKDFSPISLAAAVPNVIVVNPSVKATSVKELIALLKSEPGKYGYGSSGVGTPPHLSGELFKSMAGVEMAHLPYRGGGPAMTDLIGGQIPILFDVLTGAAAHIRSGAARAIAVTTNNRAPSFAHIPTVAESGLLGYETYTWNAIFGPAGMQKPVIDALSREFQKVVADPDIQEKLRELSATPVGSTPEALAVHVRSELAKWSAVIKSIGLKLE